MTEADRPIHNGSLEGRVVVVTGGSQGIGRGVAQVLAERGASIVVCARSPQTVAVTTAELNRTAPALGVALDLTAPKAADELVGRTVEHFGAIHSIVCCHGTLDSPSGNFLDFDAETFQRAVDINLVSSFRCAQSAARQMVAQGTPDGRIVLIGSIDSIAAEHHCVGYNASKAGVLGLMRGIALDLAPHGITCNAILPGWVSTPMVANSLPDAVLSGDVAFDLTPTNLLGVPEDIGLAAAYFVDPRNRYATGATLVVDGGQTSSLLRPGALWA